MSSQPPRRRRKKSNRSSETSEQNPRRRKKTAGNKNRKKSKKTMPLIAMIGLPIIAVVVIACFFLFGGKDGGGLVDLRSIAEVLSIPDSPESVWKDDIALTKQHADLLATIVDKASVDAAAPQLKEIAVKRVKLEGRRYELGELKNIAIKKLNDRSRKEREEGIKHIREKGHILFTKYYKKTIAQQDRVREEKERIWSISSIKDAFILADFEATLLGMHTPSGIFKASQNTKGTLVKKITRLEVWTAVPVDGETWDEWDFKLSARAFNSTTRTYKKPLEGIDKGVDYRLMQFLTVVDLKKFADSIDFAKVLKYENVDNKTQRVIILPFNWKYQK